MGCSFFIFFIFVFIRISNVEFVTGDSHSTLPSIVERLNQAGESPDFVLVDGDHSELGVRDDVNHVLSIKPVRPMVILMHDSFNPDCRSGMLTAAWEACPYVQLVDLDFVNGLFSPNSFDTAEAGSMWSGLGAAFLTPQKRTEPLVIKRTQQAVVDAVREISIHRLPPPAKAPSLMKKIMHRIRKG